MTDQERHQLVATILAGIIADRERGFIFLQDLDVSAEEASRMNPIAKANLIIDKMLQWSNK